MLLTSILFTLMNIMPSSAPNPTSIVGTWSEFGCEQDQIVIKSSGQMIMKLWAGDEYGWLTQYRYWSGSEKDIDIRSKKYKSSDVVEEWSISENLDTELLIVRNKPDGEPRTVRLSSCD